MKLQATKDEIQAIAELVEDHPLCDMQLVEDGEREGLFKDLAAVGGDMSIITEIAVRARKALRLLEEAEADADLEAADRALM